MVTTTTIRGWLAVVARRAALLSLATLMVACSAPAEKTPTDCSAQRPVATPYARQATGFLRLGQLPKGASVVVRDYRLRVAREAVAPCGQLQLRKEVALVRAPKGALVLKEVREFYAEDGTLIVRAIEDVSAQLSDTGAYGGGLSLPIPARAPAGDYRIVNKLLWEGGKGKPVLLSEAVVKFRVVQPTH